jgi:antitoxin (DNA-binding transcriptional repressor) of toxin-antitoxin stability system
MRAVTIKEAKSRLNELIEAALEGEEVVLMRGSSHVAAIIPITELDLELGPRLTDERAARIWRDLARSGTSAGTSVFDSPELAAAHLRVSMSKRPRRSASRG